MPFDSCLSIEPLVNERNKNNIICVMYVIWMELIKVKIVCHHHCLINENCLLCCSTSILSIHIVATDSKCSPSILVYLNER